MSSVYHGFSHLPEMIYYSNMIPKTIHYCWFGNTPKNDLILRCIESWKKTCPDFVIKEWNEQNFDVSVSPFTARMYGEKKWAFVSDYARLDILNREGGFYLDTDMLLLRSLSPLCDHTCVLGEESPGVISAGMIGAEQHHPFIKACKEYYDTHKDELSTIPRVLSKVFSMYTDKHSLTVLPPLTFYPFDSYSIHNYHGQPLDKTVMGVHMWNYSWGSPLNKFFKKIGIHKVGVAVAEKLGIKRILKKLLGFI